MQLAAWRDGMRVSGGPEFKQSDFAIAPVSILGGAIRVQDQISLRFTVFAAVGNRSDPPG